jgi:CRP-like cAMP-binding protein
MDFTQADFEQAVSRAAVFRGAAQDDIRAIARLGRARLVEEGGYFFMQGDPAAYLYILLTGRAKLSVINPDGQQVNLRTLVPHQLFGALGAVEATGVYPAGAQALEDSAALAIPNAAFGQLMAARPQVAFGVLRLMAGYIQEMQERYTELATQRVEQRIAHTLLRLATQAGRKIEKGVLIELAFSRQDLAEMAGTTLYTVSRVLSAWEKQGLLTTGRERVTITNPHGLVRIADDLVK